MKNFDLFIELLVNFFRAKIQKEEKWARHTLFQRARISWR
jgi:hypothetical protein